MDCGERNCTFGLHLSQALLLYFLLVVVVVDDDDDICHIAVAETVLPQLELSVLTGQEAGLASAHTFFIKL